MSNLNNRHNGENLQQRQNGQSRQNQQKGQHARSSADGQKKIDWTARDLLLLIPAMISFAALCGLLNVYFGNAGHLMGDMQYVGLMAAFGVVLAIAIVLAFHGTKRNKRSEVIAAVVTTLIHYAMFLAICPGLVDKTNRGLYGWFDKESVIGGVIFLVLMGVLVLLYCRLWFKDASRSTRTAQQHQAAQLERQAVQQQRQAVQQQHQAVQPGVRQSNSGNNINQQQRNHR